MATFQDFKSIEEFIKFINKNHSQYAGTFTGADAFTRLGIDPAVAKDPRKLEKFLKDYTPKMGLSKEQLKHDINSLNRGMTDTINSFKVIENSLRKMGLGYVIRSNGPEAVINIVPLKGVNGQKNARDAKLQERLNNIVKFEFNLVDQMGQTIKNGMPSANEYVSGVRKGANGRLEYTMTTEASMYMHELAKAFSTMASSGKYNLNGADQYRQQEQILNSIENRIKRLKQDLSKGVDPLTLSNSEALEDWKDSNARTMSRTGAQFRTGMGSTKHFASMLAQEFKNLKSVDNKTGLMTTKYLERDLDNMTKQLALAHSPEDLKKVINQMGKLYPKYAANPQVWQYIDAYMTGLFLSGVPRFQGRVSDSAHNRVAYHDLDLPGITQLALRGQRKQVQTTRGIGENYHPVSTGKNIRLGTSSNTPLKGSAAYSIATISEAAWKKALKDTGLSGGFSLGGAILDEKFLQNFQMAEAKKYSLTKEVREEYYSKHEQDILRKAVKSYLAQSSSGKVLAKDVPIFWNQKGQLSFGVSDKGGKGKKSSHIENLVSKENIQDYIERALISQYFNLQKGERIQGGTINKGPNGDWNFNLERDFKGTSFKAVNEGMGTDRINLNFVSRELIRKAAEYDHYAADVIDEIDGFVVKNSKVEAKHLYDNFRGITDRVSDIYLQEVEKNFSKDANKKTKAEQDLVKLFNDQLGEIGTWALKEGTMVLTSNGKSLSDPSQFLLKLGQMERLTRNLGGAHSLNLNRLSNNDLYRIEDGEIHHNAGGNQVVYKNLLRFANGEVKFNDYFNAHEPEDQVQYGFREMQALHRASGILRQRDKRRGGGIDDYLTRLYGTVDPAFNARLNQRFSWAKELTSRPLVSEAVLNGDLTALKINASDLRTMADLSADEDDEIAEGFKNGSVSGAYLQNALIVQKKQLEHYKKLQQEKSEDWLQKQGIYSAADIKAYVQTNTPYTDREGFAGQYLALPYFDFALNTNDNRSIDELIKDTYGINAQNIIINRMLNAVARENGEIDASGSSYRIGNAIQRGFDEYNTILNTKNGSQYLKANKYALDNGLFSLASATVVDNGLDGIVMSDQDLRRELKGASKEDLKNLYQHIFGEGSAKDFNALYGNNDKTGSKAVREAILEQMLTNGASLPAFLNRFPTLLGRDVLGAKIYASKDVGEGTFKISPALWQIINGDFDGDKGLINLLFKNTSPELLKDVEALAKIDSEKADLFYGLNKGYLNGEAPKGVKVDDFNKAFNERVAGDTTYLTQTGKQFVGQFSNIREAFSNAMYNLGLDEATSTDADVVGGIKLMRSFMQLFEQKAISAKKSEAGGEDSTALTTQLSNFYKNYFANGNAYGTKDAFAQMIGEAQKLGIVGEDSGLFKDHETNRAVIDWFVDMAHMTGGKNSQLWKTLTKSWGISKKASIQDVKEILNDPEITEADKLARFNISKELLLQGYQFAADAIARNGGQVNGYNIGNIMDVITGANKGVLPGINSYGGNLKTRNLTPGEREFLKAQGIYLSGLSGKEYSDFVKNNPNSALSDYGRYFNKQIQPQIEAQMREGTFGPWTTPTALVSNARNVLGQGHGYLNLESFDAALAAAIADPKGKKYSDFLGFSQEAFEEQRNAYIGNRIFGTDVHNQIELLGYLSNNAKFNKLFKGGKLTGNVNDIIKALSGKGATVKEQEFANMLQLMQTRGNFLWEDEASRSRYLENVFGTAQAQYAITRQLAGNNAQNILGHELAFSGNTGGKNLAGRLDAAVLNDADNTLWIVDYKQHKGGKYSASDALQTMIYQNQFESFRNAYKDKILDFGQFMSEYNTNDTFKQHFGRLGLGAEDVDINGYSKFIEALFARDSNNEFKNKIRTALSVADTDTGLVKLFTNLEGSENELKRSGVLSLAYENPELLKRADAQEFLLNALGADLSYSQQVDLQKLSHEPITSEENARLKEYENSFNKIAEDTKKAAEIQEKMNAAIQQFGKDSEVVKAYQEVYDRLRNSIDETYKSQDELLKAMDMTRLGGRVDEIAKGAATGLTTEATEKAAEKKAKETAQYQKQWEQSLAEYQRAQEAVWKVEKFRNKAKGRGQQELADMRMEIAQEDLAKAQNTFTVMSDRLKEMGVDLNSPQYQEALNRAQKMMDISYKQNVQLTEQKGLFGKLADGIKMSMSRMFSFGMIGYRIVGKLSQSFQKIIAYAQQLDQAMVNIQIVTGKSREEAFNLMDTYNQLAKQLGSTTTEVANSANVWLRQGYSVNKVNELITSSLYLSKLGMLDTATAAKDLTGIIKGFKLEVSEATNVVSKLTMIDQNAAVSAGNIATAMQQVSASAQQAGLNIDTTMGYISTIADVSQKDPGSIGSSLRTIISRYGTVKAGAFSNMGVDNTGDDLENINDIEKVLRRLGISIRTNTMEFRDLDEVLDEIADRWVELSSVEQNAIATAFAGTRQRESFLILMNNMKKAHELTAVAAESHGMAELKYQAYLSSSEAATKRLQNAWEGLSNEFRTSDFLAGVKKGFAWLIENLPRVAGLLGSIMVSFKSMRGVRGLFANNQTIFSGIGQRISGAWGNALGYATGYNKDERGGLLGKLVNLGQLIRSDTKRIADVETRRISQDNKGSGALSGGALSNKHFMTGDRYVGDRLIRKDMLTGQWHYVNENGKLGRKISSNDTISLLGQQIDEVGAQEGKFAVNTEAFKKSFGENLNKKLGTFDDSQIAILRARQAELADKAKGIIFTHEGQKYYRDLNGQWINASTGFTVNKSKLASILNNQAKMGKNHDLNAEYEALQAVNTGYQTQLGNLTQQQREYAAKQGKIPQITDFAAKQAEGAYFKDGKWYYKNHKEIKNEAMITALNEQQQQQQAAFDKEKQNQINAMRKQQKAQERKQKVATATAAGITAGVTQGLTTGLSFKNSDGGEASAKAKAAVGVTTGLTTAVATGFISAIPYVGPILGPTLGPLIGQVFGRYVAPLLGNLIDQQAIARRERSKDAEKTYNTLKSINNDTEKLKSLSQKSSWSYEDYKQATTTVDGIIKQMFGNSKAARALAPSLLRDRDTSGLSDAALVEKLAEKFRSDYLSVNATEKTRQDLINAWEQALAKEMANQYEASQEANVYKYNDTLNNPTVKGAGARQAIRRFANETGAGIVIDGNKVTFTDASVEDRLLTEQKLLNYLQDQGEETTGFYKALQKSIADLNSTIGELTDMTESINKERLNAAVISSNVLNYSTTQIKEKGIDVITKEVLDALNNMENGGLYLNSSNTNYKAQWNGSYNNLGETAKNYLTDYFRGNSKLLGLLTQESYTLKDVLVKGLLGDLDSTEALTFLNKFSKGLGTTIDKLENYIDDYGDFTLGDLLLGDSDVFAKIESLNEILNNIVSATGLSAQNTMDIISKYPQYIKYLGDTSSLTKAIASDIQSWIQLQTQGFAQAINENTTIYDNVFDNIKENFEGTEFYSWFIKGENFGEISNLGSFYDKYFSLSEKEKKDYAAQFKEIDEMVSKEYGSFQTNFTTKYIDIAKDYYSKLYEMQISNLEAQKSALENINSQREYENKLVEARLKLENAQNEKQMVYREGIGFVYEADQEAVQQAQEELDQLETEKMTDMLQMQIDELQNQKQWLDEYAERNQFKAMAEAVKGLTEKDGPLATLNSTGQDLKTAADNILQAYANINHVSVDDLKKTAAEKDEDERRLASQQLLESGQAILSSKEKLNLAQKAASGDTESLQTLLNSDAQFKSDYEKAGSKLDKQKVLANYLQSAKDNYNSSLSNFQSSYTTAGQLGIDVSKFALSNDIMASDVNSQMGAGGEYAEEKEESKYGRPNIPAGLTGVAVEEAQEGILSKLKQTGWNKRVYLAYTKKGNKYYKYMIGLDTEDEQEAEQIIKRMLGNRFPNEELYKIKKTDYLSNTSGGASRGKDLVKEYFTNDFGYNVNPSALKKVSPFLGGAFYQGAWRAGASGDGEPSYYDRIMFDDADDGDLRTSDIVSVKELGDFIESLINYEGDEEGFKDLFPKDRNYLGSLSTRGGFSAISEFGPELFATPGLSGTALIPEGSKVLPAEATKGLWEFGNFASEFVKPLRSLMSGFSGGDSTIFGNDESTNINTLNITLRADRDFDAEKFVQQLKMLQAISKNNA